MTMQQRRPWPHVKGATSQVVEVRQPTPKEVPLADMTDRIKPLSVTALHVMATRRPGQPGAALHAARRWR